MTARLAIVGAFPFPLAQGSQVFARDQARALAASGARVTVLCYGTGDGAPPEDLRVVRAPRAACPSSLRAGPSLGKPLADAALLATYLAAWRRERFELALAHNAEAAVVALAARPITRVPVVYVCHTLLAHELGSYAPGGLARAADAVGRRIDRSLAARADGVLALCEAAAKDLGPGAGGPIEVIPPGLDPGPPPGPAAQAAACARFGLAAGAFALYAGNLDGYQALDTLVEAARRLAPGSLAVATHDTATRTLPGVRVLRVETPEEVRALTFAAGAAVLPRRTPGGFPIKLLNYMEAGRAIVARESLAGGLEAGHSAELLPDDADGAAFARALGSLLAERLRAGRLGRAARARLVERHAWKEIARRTLAFAEAVRGGARRPAAAPTSSGSTPGRPPGPPGRPRSSPESRRRTSCARCRRRRRS